MRPLRLCIPSHLLVTTQKCMGSTMGSAKAPLSQIAKTSEFGLQIPWCLKATPQKRLSSGFVSPAVTVVKKQKKPFFTRKTPRFVLKTPRFVLKIPPFCTEKPPLLYSQHSQGCVHLAIPGLHPKNVWIVEPRPLRSRGPHSKKM